MDVIAETTDLKSIQALVAGNSAQVFLYPLFNFSC